MTYVIMKKIRDGKGKGKPPLFKKVTQSKKQYPSIDYLIKEYDLKLTDIISVRHTKRAKRQYSRKIYKGYRSPWRHIYNGPLSGYATLLRNMYEQRVWSKLRRCTQS